MGGPGLSSATESQMADAMAALAEGLNAQANTNTNTTSSNVGFGKSDKDTSLAENANKADTTNSTNTSSPATQDSSTTKGADLSNDNAVSVNDNGNNSSDYLNPADYGVDNSAKGATQVADVTTPNTPATSTATTSPLAKQSIYDVALNDLITAFGQDQVDKMLKTGNPLSQVKIMARGGKVNQGGPLATIKRKSKRA